MSLTIAPSAASPRHLTDTPSTERGLEAPRPVEGGEAPVTAEVA